MISEKELSALLFEHDPGHTSCTHFKFMEDEYDTEALMIRNLLMQGVPFRYAYISVMTSQFYPEIIFDFPFFYKIELTYYKNKV